MRDVRIYDTATGEQFPVSSDGETVRMYVCGLTVSDDPHLGHARTWVHADVIRRYLEYVGYDVQHVENFTDVNEKIVARTAEDVFGDTEAHVARQFTQRVIDAMRGLNLRRAQANPRVSESIDAIIELIEQLIDRGHAYEANGSVYFDVTTFEDYGKLSNQSVDSLASQGDEHDDVMNEKRNPQDFALWKAGPVRDSALEGHVAAQYTAADVPTNGQTWESPWSEGRPGWHIECSAMSKEHLSLPLDVHIGGQDLVFPHHENEIAQTEGATGKTFVRNWAHIGLLDVDADDDEEKMSSSLGNFVTVDSALDDHGADVLRTFYLTTHYRNRQTLSDNAIADATARLATLRRGFATAEEALGSVDAVSEVKHEDFRETVEEADTTVHEHLDDDFDTRSALNALGTLAQSVDTYVANHERYDYHALDKATTLIETIGTDVFGLTLSDENNGDVDELLTLLVDVREAAREDEQYDLADTIRKELRELGYEVQDTEEGQTVFRADDT